MMYRMVLAGALSLCIPGVAGVAAAPDDPDRTLSAQELTRYFEPYAPAVRTCYADHGTGKEATGVLRLELIIQPDGKVLRFGVVAPGVDKVPLRKLDACLRKLSATWSFPVRKGYTTAVLPFLFQRTYAPGAGPIESCWDVRGCPPGRLGKPPTSSKSADKPKNPVDKPGKRASAPSPSPRPPAAPAGGPR